MIPQTRPLADGPSPCDNPAVQERITLGSRGTVQIPTPMLEKLGLWAGDPLTIEDGSGGLFLRPAVGDPPRPPLILTLSLDPATFAAVDALRRLHFPPERNHLAAHVTLFHCLPGDHEAEIARRLTALTRATAPLPMTLTAPRSLGRGVAIEIACDGARQIRAELATEWHPWLTPQDRQPFRPHVTVQNKVTPHAARALYENLRCTWTPRSGLATGLTLSRYRGGPWEPAGSFPFTADAT